MGIPPFYAKDRDTLYRNIKFHDPKVDYPFLSDSAKDLCCRLLDKDPALRIGSGSSGTKEIRQHPWFKDIDWEKMYLRDMTPPYKPILDSLTDTKHFPKEFTAMKLTPPDVEEALQDPSS